MTNDKELHGSRTHKNISSEKPQLKCQELENLFIFLYFFLPENFIVFSSGQIKIK